MTVLYHSFCLSGNDYICAAVRIGVHMKRKSLALILLLILLLAENIHHL